MRKRWGTWRGGIRGGARWLWVLAAGMGLLGCSGATEAQTRGGPPDPMARVRTVPCPDVPDDPGRVTLHRLNASEYDRTLRDLLGAPGRPSLDFPADDSSGGGFDNDADVLIVSPLLMELYQDTAERLVAEAWTRDASGKAPPYVRLCEPAGPDGMDCARRTLQRFLRRAFRRPVAPDELERHLSLVSKVVQEGGTLEAGLQWSLSAALVSPHFLYRVELDPDPASAAAHPVSPVELASRLSYFLWSSMPDETLLSLAESGELQRPSVLEAQVERMITDPKAEALLTNFAGQWLGLRELDGVTPDPLLFPDFDEPLRASMRRETELFFLEFLEKDRPIWDLLQTDFAWVDDRLAAHYGLPLPNSPTHVRVVLPPRSPRGGLMGQGSVLTITSHPNRTAPVLRGLFVLTKLLCQQPPAPPPNVEGLPGKPDPGLSLRRRLEEHLQDPDCKACHELMDPIGFSLEGFDAIGRSRTVEADSGAEIDDSGVLPDGTQFTGALALSTILREDPSLSACISRHLLTYALGREVRQQDACHLDDIAWRAELNGASLRNLIESLITSRPFTHRRGEPEEAP